MHKTLAQNLHKMCTLQNQMYNSFKNVINIDLIILLNELIITILIKYFGDVYLNLQSFKYIYEGAYII